MPPPRRSSRMLPVACEHGRALHGHGPSVAVAPAWPQRSMGGTGRRIGGQSATAHHHAPRSWLIGTLGTRPLPPHRPLFTMRWTPSVRPGCMLRHHVEVAPQSNPAPRPCPLRCLTLASRSRLCVKTCSCTATAFAHLPTCGGAETAGLPWRRKSLLSTKTADSPCRKYRLPLWQWR